MFGYEDELKEQVVELHSEVEQLRKENAKLTNLADQVESMLSTATRWINVYHEPYWAIDDKQFQAVNKVFEELK